MVLIDIYVALLQAEAQRKQAEIEKQLADLQAKQQAELLRQQQAQQEFAYQQHLQQQQQYMALQQQQMQTYYAAQQAAMFGVGASGGVGDGAAAAQYAALNVRSTRTHRMCS
jgi:UDP-N-acetylglucosamine 2-epimerase